MKERINWIDWGKALAVITVVFCQFWTVSRELQYQNIFFKATI